MKLVTFGVKSLGNAAGGRTQSKFDGTIGRGVLIFRVEG